MTISANSKQELSLQLTTPNAAPWSQQIHFYLDIDNQLIERQLEVSGVAK